MGIDVYMRWRDQTQEEREAQYTGFSIMHGHVGYLREAYHGDPYATKVMFPECWDDDLIEREGIRAPVSEKDLDRFATSVKLSSAEVVARPNQMLPKLRDYFGPHAQVEFDPVTNSYTENTGAVRIPAATLRERLPDAIEATAERYADSDEDFVEQVQKSFTDFVELYERLETEGREPAVYVSY